MDRRGQLGFKWRIATASLIVLLVHPAFCPALHAVDCNPPSMSLSSQAAVDTFQDTYGPCDRVLTLHIDGPDIVNLEGLSALREAGDSLYIENNPVLASLAGLASLNSVGRNLWLRNNTSLAGMDGPVALTGVGGTLAIFENGALAGIDGLAALTRVGGSLVIRDNAVLGGLDGLAALTSVAASPTADQRFLHIENNPALVNLDGLSSLTGVSAPGNSGYAWVVINNNAALTDIDGLSALTGIEGDLIISQNASLANIDGLSALTRVVEISLEKNASLNGVDGLNSLTNLNGLTINDNGSLADVNGLASMTAIWNDLEIRDNAMLSQCAGLLRLVDEWDDAQPGPGDIYIPDVGGEVVIGANGDGCNSVQDILENLDPSRINAGLNDAWFNPETDGQGFFISIFPDLGAASLAWFTYDTALPADGVTANLGDPGHRWLTAVGPIVGNQVLMDIEFTSGGLFDTATEVQRTDPPGSDGTIVLTFTSCNSGTAEYDIPSIGRQGTVPIQRVANDNIGLCEALSAY